MFKFAIKRVLIAVPVLLMVVLMIFFMLNVIPGDPITVMMKEHIKPAVIENLRQKMHLDDPFFVKYAKYIGGMLQGDLGISYKLSRPVVDLIKTAFPNTLKLAISAALVSWLIGIPAGILSAVKKNSAVDRLFMSFALFGISMPVFWIGLMLQNLCKGFLPISGLTTWQHYILPSIVLGWSSAGNIARLTRSNLLEIMKLDYIRTARAKGRLELGVVLMHGLKNALLPVITMMAIQVAGLLSGAVITETIFSINGIGRLSVSAIQTRDMPLLQGTVIFTTVIIILGNMVADILYSVIDPRIRLQ